MLNTLLFVHIAIAILLVIVILLQKTSKDGLSGISGGGNNMGLVSGRSAANFLTRTTVILAVLFFINAIILANLSSGSNKDVLQKQDAIQNHESAEEKSLPMAK